MEVASFRASAPSTRMTCSVQVYPSGTVTDRGRLEGNGKQGSKRPLPKKKRGGINSFSKASAARLRRLLAQTRGPQGWPCFGLTLTVPGPKITDTDWRRLWRAFLARARRLEGVAFIWRIEKQERGQPHMHCVCWGERNFKSGCLLELWLKNLDILGPCEGPADIKREMTFTSTDGKRTNSGEFKPGRAKVTSRSIWPGAFLHAVKIDSLSEKKDMCWWRYLASHASKSKQSQLGWQGRQWGVFNKRLLALAEATVIELPGNAMNKVIRYLKRVTRSRRASNHGRQTWFTHPDTVRRICEWATGNCQPVRKLECSDFIPFRMGQSERRARAKAKRMKLLGVLK